MWADREADLINALDDLRTMLRDWRACDMSDFYDAIGCLSEAETYLTEALAEITPKADRERQEDMAIV